MVGFTLLPWSDFSLPKVTQLSVVLIFYKIQTLSLPSTFFFENTNVLQNLIIWAMYIAVLKKVHVLNMLVVVFMILNVNLVYIAYLQINLLPMVI